MCSVDFSPERLRGRNDYCSLFFLEYTVKHITIVSYFIPYCFNMNVLVYNGEKFKRNKLWYLIFAVIVASVFLLSILNDNIVGGVLIFFLLWWYFYYSTISNQVVKMTIQQTQLIVWNKNYPRSTFTGYVLEIHAKTQEIKNIVFLTAKWHMIYTFDDSIEHISAFVTELDTYLPMLGNYHQTALEKFSRKMKL